MAVMIGVDPHKGSHTAVALDEREESLGELRVRSATNQVEQLITWATPLGERTWAIEGAGGLGYLLAQQFVAAGERVVDVQPKLAARVRLLATGASNKNDPNDARSVAVAALGSSTVPEVRVEDHAAVMKVWAKRHRDLSRQHNRVACRLHSVLCDLVPGGIAGEISPAQATRLLDELEPAGAVATARHELAVELVADLVRLADQRREARRRIAAAVTASTTTVTELFGVGPIVAATVIGEVGDISRFPTRDHFAAYNGTAPIEASSGGRRKVFRLSRRGNRRLNHVIHMAAVTQIRFRHTDGRGYYDRKIAQGHTGKEAIRALKRRISDAIYTRLRHDAERTARLAVGPGGHSRNDSVACAAGSHPEHRLFGQATPGPERSLRPSQTTATASTSKPPQQRPPRGS
jgi:transposase